MSVFSQKDAEEFLRQGSKEFRYDRTVQLTPGARDIFSESGIKVVFDSGSIPSLTRTAQTSAGAGSTSDAQLFESAEARNLKEQICEIGRRIWLREYSDGNGGNISCRLAPDRYLCTPTGVSKGFLKPDMIGMIDGKGKQLAGSWQRTSEILTHLAIYNTTPAAVSVCHAHPVHAGAFAIKGLIPPPRLIPELEVFVGQVAYAPYCTPGSQEMHDAIVPLAPQHQSILMGNHGVICWGTSVEDAYFKMEITDAYCRTVILAQSIPGGTSIPCEKMGELLDIKKKMGLPDSRFNLKPAELCEVDPWAVIQDHPCGCSTPAAACDTPTSHKATNAELETLVQRLTEEILKKLNGEK